MKPVGARLHAQAVSAFLAVALAACAAPPAEQGSAMSPAERGAYLVRYGGCDDCHTPKIMTPMGPVPDTTRWLSGHPAGESLPAVPRGALGPVWMVMGNNHLTAWAGPWGVSFGVNLTPHETGLRSWTDSLFIATMRTGKHMGSGRPILPPMPYYSLAALTDEDLRAVFAFLQSLPPIENQVPAPLPPAGSQP